MKVYPEDIQRVLAETKAKAEESKKLVQPAQPRDDGPFVRPLHQPPQTKK